MTISRAIRTLLAVASVAIVVWAFIDVARRARERWRLEHERPVTLTILHWGGKDEAQIVDTLAAHYMQQNPKVRIERIGVPGAGELQGKLKTMISAGMPPDLFYLPPDLLAEAAELKLVRPVDEFVQRELAKPGGQAWFDDYYPLLIKAWRYDTATQQRGLGPLFGLPKDFTTAIFYVNLDLFEKAGVRVPYDGWTWDAFDDAMKKIRALSNSPGFEGRDIYGGTFQIWGDTIRHFVWTFGGDFFGTKPDGTPDFRNVTLDEPAAQEALQFIYRLCRVDQTVYYPSGIAKESGQEFFNGNIGCIGPIGRWMTPRFKDITAFRWDVVPVPYKKKEFQCSQIYYTAWSMSAGCKHPDEAFALMKYLCGGEGAILQSRAGLAIPPLQSVANSADFLAPQGLPPHHAQVFLDATRYMRLQQMPREPEWNRMIADQINRSIQIGELTPMQAAKELERRWLAELDAPLRRQQWHPMNWSVIVYTVIAIALAAVTVLWWNLRRQRLGALDRAHERAGFAFILPWIIGFVALTLGPMIVSLLLSFTQWTAMEPMREARSVGTANYAQLVRTDPKFTGSLLVTLYFVALMVPVTQVTALAVAMLMNVRVRGISVYRTIYFIPSLIVASVVGAVLWMQMYNNQYGIVNQLLRAALGNPGKTITVIGAVMFSIVLLRAVLQLFDRRRIHRDRWSVAGTVLPCGALAIALIGATLWRSHATGPEPPDWFGRDARVWAIPGFVIMSVWGVGGAMILYLAGLKGIPPSLYEAATIDGAGRSRQFWHVTLPLLSPLIFYNVVMGMIGGFQFFVQPLVMTGGGPNDLTLSYVLNLYRQAFEFHNMGYASAMAWVLFLILLGLTMLVFRASKNLVYYEGLKT